jgi:hypothetical protein
MHLTIAVQTIGRRFDQCFLEEQESTSIAEDLAAAASSFFR